MNKVKQIVILSIIILLLQSSLTYGGNSNNISQNCNFANSFLTTLKGKDFLNYMLIDKISNFFVGKNKQKSERIYSFIIKMAWKWRSLDIASPVIQNYSIKNCILEGDRATIQVTFYFHYFLFFTKSFDITIPFERQEDNRWQIKFPLLNELPLN